MAKTEDKSKKYYTIDIFHILKMLWKKMWIIVLAGLICATAGFAVARFLIKPTYSSTVKLYVNNSSINVGSFNITASEITASQSLVKTYGEILDSRTTLERVIKEAKVDYTYEELSSMITYGSANGTEIMYVTVTSNDPYEADKIADCIKMILPIRIDEIIDGATMETVDDPVPNPHKVAPSITKYTAIGLMLGLFFSVVVVAIIAIADDRIHDEEYILENYEYPILAKIPNLVEGDSKKYGYYYQSKAQRNDANQK